MSDLTPRERYERDIHLLVQASRVSPELREAVRTVENHVRGLEAALRRVVDADPSAASMNAARAEARAALAAVSAETEGS